MSSTATETRDGFFEAFVGLKDARKAVDAINRGRREFELAMELVADGIAGTAHLEEEGTRLSCWEELLAHPLEELAISPSTLDVGQTATWLKKDLYDWPTDVALQLERLATKLHAALEEAGPTEAYRQKVLAAVEAF